MVAPQKLSAPWEPESHQKVPPRLQSLAARNETCRRQADQNGSKRGGLRNGVGRIDRPLLGSRSGFEIHGRPSRPVTNLRSAIHVKPVRSASARPCCTAPTVRRVG